MKLVYAIVNSDDTYAVNKGLLKAGIRATKLSSTGGFLKSGNTTLLIGVEDDKVNEVKELVDHNCKTREITTSLLTVTMPGDTFVPYPLEVKVGGATLFVLNVEEFLRV